MHSYSLLALFALPQLSLASLTYTFTTTASGPTADDTASNCIAWYTVILGDSCNKVTDAFHIGMGDFLSWNPSISDDCKSSFKAGYAYCVGVKTADIPGNATALSNSSANTSTPYANGTASVTLGVYFATTSTTINATSAAINTSLVYAFIPPTKVAQVDYGMPNATRDYFGMPFQTLDARFPLRKNVSMASVLLCEASNFNTSTSYCAIADAYSQPAFYAYSYGGNDCRLSPFLEMLNGFVNVSSIAVSEGAETCRFYNTIDCKDDEQWIQASADKPVTDILDMAMDDDSERSLVSGGWPVLSFMCGKEYKME